MATSYAPIILQLFNDYGAILSGGKIETFEAGTTTPLVTYQDLDGEIENTNPVVLNEAGRGVIRVTNGVAYKFVITDYLDNEIATLDDIIVGEASGSIIGYLVHLTFVDTPGIDQFMGGHLFDRAVEFPANFDGSIGSVQINPASTYTISLQQNDVEIGTIEIDTDGNWTFFTTDPVLFEAGDKLTFIGDGATTAAYHFLASLVGQVDE